ncbi:hypothetical protein PHISCL_06836 [Aspergillus sclerotialis]|uniref:Uncharacterized protein n=1 Tax=Aspergillus sclerotialis TaxID=2070753 RepID=A0A3A2ZHE7_9EURO|nr:hypothetical protein PHISCL_06836 [Aspergillus sclerotialis]
MPLILAAIDLKLSSSHGEMNARKKRLTSLSAIVRYSETLYDVTDFVAVGINHILQLAYVTTRNLFLRPKCTQRDLLGNSSSPTQDTLHHAENRANRFIHKEKVPQPGPSYKQLGRATSWVEAFTLWPRAYLLISTSVDHSLAVGRLPSDIALPELVRHIPAMGADFRLPWSINVRSGVGFRDRDQLRLVSGSIDENTPCKRPNEHDREILTEVRSNSVHDEPGLEPQPEPETLENEEQETRTPEPTVNLNFLDLASAVEDGLLSGQGYDNTEYQVLGNGSPGEADVGNLDDGNDFDTVLLNSLSNELLRLDGIDV